MNEKTTEKELEEKLKCIQEQFQKKQRKLQKSIRVAKAKAHVRQRLKAIQQSDSPSHHHESGTEQENLLSYSSPTFGDHDNWNTKIISPSTAFLSDLSQKKSERRLSLGDLRKRRSLISSTDDNGTSCEQGRRKSLPFGGFESFATVKFHARDKPEKGRLSLCKASTKVQRQFHKSADQVSTETSQLKCDLVSNIGREPVPDTNTKNLLSENIEDVKNHATNMEVSPSKATKHVLDDRPCSPLLSGSAVNRSPLGNGKHANRLCKYKCKRLVTRTSISGSPVLSSDPENKICEKDEYYSKSKTGTKSSKSNFTDKVCATKSALNNQESLLGDLKEAQVVVFSRQLPKTNVMISENTDPVQSCKVQTNLKCSLSNNSKSLPSTKDANSTLDSEENCSDMVISNFDTFKNSCEAVNGIHVDVKGEECPQHSVGSSDCISSSQKSSINLSNELDVYDEATFEPMKKLRGRKRRSTGDRNERTSTRVSRQNLSPSSQLGMTRRGRPSRVNKKSIIISSLFHCLVDEAKRQKDMNEFVLPEYIARELKAESGGSGPSKDTGSDTNLGHISDYVKDGDVTSRTKMEGLTGSKEIGEVVECLNVKLGVQEKTVSFDEAARVSSFCMNHDTDTKVMNSEDIPSPVTKHIDKGEEKHVSDIFKVNQSFNVALDVKGNMINVYRVADLPHTEKDSINNEIDVPSSPVEVFSPPLFESPHVSYSKSFSLNVQNDETEDATDSLNNDDTEDATDSLNNDDTEDATDNLQNNEIEDASDSLKRVSEQNSIENDLMVNLTNRTKDNTECTNIIKPVGDYNETPTWKEHQSVDDIEDTAERDWNRDSLPKRGDHSGNLKQINTFQLHKDDVLVAMAMCECFHDNQTFPSLCIACLCTTEIKFYIKEDQQFNCVKVHKLEQHIRKNSRCQLYSLGDNDSMRFILQETRCRPTCLSICQYKEGEVSVMEVDRLWAKRVQVCVLDAGCFIVSCTTSETHLTKYTCTIGTHWSQRQLEPCRDQVTSLVTVKGLKEAVLGISSSVKLYIWNHNQGCLLTIVNIRDVAPSASLCPSAFIDQGYLFLPLLPTKMCRDGAGAVMVVNPSLGTSETLCRLQTASTFTGCSRATMFNTDKILVKENCGQMLLWDVYTGSILTTLDEITITNYAVSRQHIAVTHKHCVHVYNIRV